MRNQSYLKAFTSLFAFLLTLSLQANPLNLADSTGLAGDHFSLEGALSLFKQAQSPEDFEKLLNQQDQGINNLDLNEDGEIDYIRVVDHVDGDVHAIVLQVPVSKEESQDIAVIEIEKEGAEKAVLQIVGNEDIYGEPKIAEPYEVEGVGGGKGPSAADVRLERVIVNVWLWPSVRFIYRPAYRVWVSPWRWARYPSYWKPWRPHPWRVYHTRVVRHHSHFHVVRTHRVLRAHKVYTPRRSSSKIVRTRTTTRLAARGPNGKVVGKRTTTKTVVKGKNGKVATKSTKTTKVRKTKNGKTAKTTRTKTVKKSKNGKVKGRRSTSKVKRKKN